MALDGGLAGKVVVVTGGSRGIGRAIVELFAAEGADVTFFYQGNAKAAEEVLALAAENGWSVRASQVDVRDSEACRSAAEAVADRAGRIDILVNNAGVIRDNVLVGLEDQDIRTVLDVNVAGVFNVTRAVAPFMISKRAGKIVNLSSVSGAKGGRGQTNYAASKGALDSMTVGLAKEVGKEGVRVNAIRPGMIETEIHEAHGGQATIDAVAPSVPIGRAGSPEEIAEAVLWLACEAASYVHGAVIDVSGGR